MPGAVVIGAGPGIGRSVARRFARQGLPIALIARTARTLADVTEAVSPFGVPVIALTANSTDETALRAALDTATAEFGLPDVVVYNAAIIQPDRPGQLSAHAQLDAWAVNVVGAITAASHLAPEMARRGSGSFIITGGMPEPKPQYVSLSLGKAGVRTLVTLLDQEYGPSGVHVAGCHRGRSRRCGYGVRPRRHRRTLLAPAYPAATPMATGGPPQRPRWGSRHRRHDAGR